MPDGRIMFASDPDYAARTGRPALSLSFDAGSGEVRPGPKSATEGGRVPPFFANILPEGDLRNYVAARAGVTGANEFTLLELLGCDLPGAIEIESEPARHEPPGRSHRGSGHVARWHAAIFAGRAPLRPHRGRGSDSH